MTKEELLKIVFIDPLIMIIRKEKISFVPKEKGSLPRVLLLDFDKEAAIKLQQESKFQIFLGKSGFTDGAREIPRDASEIEIVFWDVSKFKPRYVINPELIQNTGSDKLKIAEKTIEDFFRQIREKDGFIGIFLGNNISESTDYIISSSMGLLNGYSRGFELKPRYTYNINLNSYNDEDLFYLFFKRFVKDENLNFIINWHSNLVNTRFYFEDEDGNHYAIMAWDRILISPKIDNLSEATLFLLQDVLPSICGENIYPDLHRFKWLEDEYFKNPEVKIIEKELRALKKEYDKKIQGKESELESKKQETYYLYELLYKDDSELFPEGEKLKDIVKKVLEHDIGFQGVRDIDKERIQEGLALKEDLRIGNEIFIEIKGTESGAKESWLDQMARHVNQYCKVSGVNLSELKQILIFNHERRKDPRERTKPFFNNPEFIKSCEKDNISLIPVFALFKMVLDIRQQKLSQKDAQNRILNSKGLFIYL